MKWHEVNFDGLVGPTHNYSGLAKGNLASHQHQQTLSNPRQAARQGLQKMRWMIQRGVVQGILPPQIRPDFRLLYRLGFRGEPQQVLKQAWQQQPNLFSHACSASAMWVANAATIAPSCDSENKKLCITPANLISHLHRSIEVEATYGLLHHVFSDSHYFRVNQALPPLTLLSDEGAANHMRVGACGDDQAACHVFVYGVDGSATAVSKRFAARQNRTASESVARLNRLPQAKTVFLQQSAEAIDAGVFHNDVIAMSHRDLLVIHEKAFQDQQAAVQQLQKVNDGQLNLITVAQQQVSLQQAVSSYLFNSQIVTRSDGERALLMPIQCQRDTQVYSYIENQLREASGCSEVAYLDLDQSMKNGGGPACLRLRIDLTDEEMSAMNGKLIADLSTIAELERIVDQYFPDQLEVAMLSDWQLVRTLVSAVEHIYQVLDLPESLLQPFLP